jgi:hypothetical protein
MCRDPRNLLILVLLGGLVYALWGRTLAAGTDGGGGDADRGMIAVTGSYGSGASALYLFDTKTRHLAVYRLDNGRALSLVAARNCTYDFMLDTYNDQSADSMQPPALRRSWQEFNRRPGSAEPAAPSSVTPPTPAGERR